MASSTRSDGTGSVYQRHNTGCERPVDRRGKSTCKCKWLGVHTSALRTDADGKRRPVRHKVTANSKSGAEAKLAEMRDKMRNGTIPSGRVPTVREWLTYWLEQVAAERNKPSTLAAYRTYVNRYLIPLLGNHRLDKLTAEHVSGAWTILATLGCPDKPGAKPLSPTSIHQAHVILARALKVAQQRGHVREPATSKMDAPSVANAEMTVLTKADAAKVVRAAHGRRNAARFTVAFTLGLRQGEALGLRWDDVDLDAGVMRVQHSLGRVTGKGLQLGTVKSRSGRRTIALPGPLLAALRAHRAEQATERLAAGRWWTEDDAGGYVFATEIGKPIDPKADWTTWRTLLEVAGVQPVRLHAARHTAITMMLAMGIPPHVVMEIAGHSRFSTTEVYVDRVDELHLDAAKRMEAFWD